PRVRGKATHVDALSSPRPRAPRVLVQFGQRDPALRKARHRRTHRPEQRELRRVGDERPQGGRPRRRHERAERARRPRAGGTHATFELSDSSHDGSGTLQADVSDGTTTIPAGTAVDSKLDLVLGEALVTWDFVPGDLVEAGLG